MRTGSCTLRPLGHATRNNELPNATAHATPDGPALSALPMTARELRMQLRTQQERNHDATAAQQPDRETLHNPSREPRFRWRVFTEGRWKEVRFSPPATRAHVAIFYGDAAAEPLIDEER